MQLLPKSRFLLHWSVVLIALSVLVIICAKSNDEATINNDSTDDTEELELGSRSALGGRYIEKLPNWLFPIICLKQLSKFDGHHCGMGIRLDREIFLASVHSIEAARRGDKYIDTKPGLFPDYLGSYFGFDIHTEWNINDAFPANKYRHWKPEHKLTYKDGIAMYKVVHRGISNPGPKEQIPVLQIKPTLDDQEPSNKTLCRVYTFGDQENGAEGVSVPSRKPVALYVQEMACGKNFDDDLCHLGPAIEREKPGDTGFLCSNFADVGAPVVCGLGRLSRVRYIVSELPSNNTGYCSRQFTAIKLKKFTKQILEDVERYATEIQ